MMRLAQAATIVVAVGLAAYFASGGVAVSQSSGPTLASAGNAVIDLNEIVRQWMPIIIVGIGAIITVILDFIRQWMKQRFNLVLEDARMRQIQAALKNAAGLVLTKVVNGKSVTIDVGSPEVKQAIEYVNQSAADAVKEFNLTSDQIAEKIIAKVGVITAPNPEMNVKSNVPPPPNPGAGG